MKFLMYGAGSIGRGFIGPLFAQAEYKVVFVDVNREIITALQERHSYRYSVAAFPPYDITVSNVSGVDGADDSAVIDEIAECDLMAVSLGSAALKKVAPIIAQGFSMRMRRSGRPLNILICENLKDSSHILRNWLESSLLDSEKPLLREKCGLIETAIGRMVPAAPATADDPLHITVEEYDFLPVDKAAFIGSPPEIPKLVPYTPFSFYEERKLYLHNMGHAVCAYLGMERGCETVAEAVSDPFIRLLTQSAMTESAAMLSVKYGIPFPQVFNHAEDLLLRFGNASLGDTCERVGRDPMRKIAAGDRLAGALTQCRKNGVYPVYISLGYASALRTFTKDVEHAAVIAKENGGLHDDETALVMELFNVLSLPDGELLRTAEQMKKNLRGSIV